MPQNKILSFRSSLLKGGLAAFALLLGLNVSGCGIADDATGPHQMQFESDSALPNITSVSQPNAFAQESATQSSAAVAPAPGSTSLPGTDARPARNEPQAGLVRTLEPQQSSTPTTREVGGRDTTADADGHRWCTYDCRNGCWQDSRVTWGHCRDTAERYGCWNARWCMPNSCC